MTEFKFDPDKKNFEFEPTSTTKEEYQRISKQAEHVRDDKMCKMSGLDFMDTMGFNAKPMSKLDAVMFALDFMPDNKAKKVVQTIDTYTKTGIKTFTNTDYSTLSKEAMKSLGRQTTENTIGGLGFLVKSYGRLMHDDQMTEKDFGNDPASTMLKSYWKGNQAVSDTIIKFGQSIENVSENIQTSDFLKADEKIFSGTFKENPNLAKVVDGAMSAATSLVGAYGVSKVTSPRFGLFVMSGIDAKELMEEPLERGEKLKAVALWGLGTVGTAAMEKLPFEKAFGKLTPKAGKKMMDAVRETSVRITDTMLAEGLTEGVQTVYQNILAKVGYDGARDIFNGAVEAVIFGALGGGMVAGVNYGIQNFTRKAEELGLSKEEQNAILQAVAQEAKNNPDAFNKALQKNMENTYNSFEKTIEEMKGTPEEQQLRQTKKELDEGYNRYFEELKQYMPEKQAKANAQLIRSSALFFSKLDGMSVKEWFDAKAPQIKWIGDIENQERTFERSVTPTKLTLDEKEINLFEALKNPELVKQYRKKDRRKSLLQFIRKRGGVKDVGGDLKAMDLHKKWGIVNNKNGESLDDMALAAWEHGYFVGEERPTINDLLEAIRDESFGNKRYAEEKELGIDDYVAQLAEEMDRLGIDYSNMSAREAEQAYNDAVAKYSNQNYVPEEQNTDEDIDALFDLSEPFFQIAEENARLDEQYPAYEGETITINGQEKTVYNSNGDRIGAYTNRIIYLNQNANESTLPHELAHFWSDMLRQSKSLKAKEILKQVDKWAEKEFERKYSIVKQGDVYVVTDKSGKTVYDLMGEGFKNEENAKAYAKEELFARGFEKYLKEGKAPSKTLKEAFENFFEWLKKIYVDMVNLDIKLSPTMRKVYGEILGGTDIDTFLSEDLDSFVEKRAEQTEESKEQETAPEEENKEQETTKKEEPKETKETRERGLAKTTSEKAKAKGIEDVEVPTYEKRSSIEMAKKADEFVKNNKQLAIDIVKGLKPEQDGIFRQDLYKSLEETAINEGDSDLLNELSRSMTVEEATELGQRIQALARGEIDPVKEMTELRDERMKKNKVTKKKIKEETDKATKQIKKEVEAAATPKEWEEFIKSLEC